MRRTSVAVLLLTGLAWPATAQAKPQDANEMEEARRILHEASLLIKEIPDRQQSSAAANIASELARVGDLPGALAVVNSLKSAADRALPLGIVAWSLDHAGNGTGALDLLESSDLGGNKAQAYEQLALSRLDRGDYDGALRIMKLVDPQPCLGIGMSLRIAQQKEKSGDKAGARQAIRETIGIVDSVREEDRYCAGTLVDIAGAQMEMGDQAGALGALNHLSEIAHRPGASEDLAATNTLLQLLAMGQARAGDIAGSFRTIEELPEGNLRDAPLSDIARQQARNGDFREALKTVAETKDEQLRTLWIREVVLLEAASGKPSNAFAVFSRIADEGERVYLLASLALAQAQQDDSAVRDTLQLTLEAAQELGAKVPQDVLGYIAVTQGILRDFSGAQQSIAGIKDAEARVWPLWNITDMMAEAGDMQGAIALASNEHDAYPKAYALLGAADGIIKHAKAQSKAKFNNGSLN